MIEAYLLHFDDEARRYATPVGKKIDSSLPPMYSCARRTYENLVYIDTGLTMTDHDNNKCKKVVMASCYFDPFWYDNDNTEANANYFILSAIADASQSSRKVEAYQYAHLLCLEADATRDPLGEGFKVLKELALNNKNIHGAVFSSVWAYVESRRFHASVDSYQFPSSWPYTTPLCLYRREDGEHGAAEGMVFCNGLFVAKDASKNAKNDSTFFEVIANSELEKQYDGYDKSEHFGDVSKNFNEWFKDSKGTMPNDPDLLTIPPYNHDFIAQCQVAATEKVVSKDHIDLSKATTQSDKLWDTYWTGTEVEEEDKEQMSKIDPENLWGTWTDSNGTYFKASYKADGTDDIQKKRYRADACFNAFKDQKAPTRALHPIQWSQGYEEVSSRTLRSDMALLYLEARGRSARGFAALSLISKIFTNPEKDSKSVAGRRWAEHVQDWLEEEGIKYDTQVAKNHHEEPIMYGGKVSVVWRYGKQGPYPTMIKDAFTGKNRRAIGRHDPFQEENHDLNQAQRGHYMMLGKFPGVVDHSPTGREAAQKVGFTFWIMNKDPPPNTVSRWIPSGSGSVENVWLSNAKDQREEAERAYAADRPPYFLVSDLEAGRWMEDHTAGGEFVNEESKEKNSAYKMPPLMVWVRDEHNQLVEKDSIQFKDSGNYYPSLVYPYSTIPNPTIIPSVAAPAAQSADYSDDYDNYDYSGDYSDDYSDY